MRTSLAHPGDVWELEWEETREVVAIEHPKNKQLMGRIQFTILESNALCRWMELWSVDAAETQRLF